MSANNNTAATITATAATATAASATTTASAVAAAVLAASSASSDPQQHAAHVTYLQQHEDHHADADDADADADDADADTTGQEGVQDSSSNSHLDVSIPSSSSSSSSAAAATNSIAVTSDGHQLQLGADGTWQFPQIEWFAYTWRSTGGSKPLTTDRSLRRSYRHCATPGCPVTMTFDCDPRDHVVHRVVKHVHNHPPPQPKKRRLDRDVSELCRSLLQDGKMKPSEIVKKLRSDPGSFMVAAPSLATVEAALRNHNDVPKARSDGSVDGDAQGGDDLFETSSGLLSRLPSMQQLKNINSYLTRYSRPSQPVVNRIHASYYPFFIRKAQVSPYVFFLAVSDWQVLQMRFNPNSPMYIDVSLPFANQALKLTTVLMLAEGVTIPVAWLIHDRGSSQCYDGLFQYLIELSDDSWEPPHILGGFDEPLRVAAARCWPEAIIVRDAFHFVHANVRWLVQHDFKKLIPQAVPRLLAMTQTENTLQLDEVTSQYICLITQSAVAYFSYFRQTWMTETPVSSWSFSLRRPGHPSREFCVPMWHQRLKYLMRPANKNSLDQFIGSLYEETRYWKTLLDSPVDIREMVSKRDLIIKQYWEQYPMLCKMHQDLSDLPTPANALTTSSSGDGDDASGGSAGGNNNSEHSSSSSSNAPFAFVASTLDSMPVRRSGVRRNVRATSAGVAVADPSTMNTSSDGHAGASSSSASSAASASALATATGLPLHSSSPAPSSSSSSSASSSTIPSASMRGNLMSIPGAAGRVANAVGAAMCDCGNGPRNKSCSANLCLFCCADSPRPCRVTSHKNAKSARHSSPFWTLIDDCIKFNITIDVGLEHSVLAGGSSFLPTNISRGVLDSSGSSAGADSSSSSSSAPNGSSTSRSSAVAAADAILNVVSSAAKQASGGTSMVRADPLYRTLRMQYARNRNPYEYRVVRPVSWVRSGVSFSGYTDDTSILKQYHLDQVTDLQPNWDHDEVAAAVAAVKAAVHASNDSVATRVGAGGGANAGIHDGIDVMIPNFHVFGGSESLTGAEAEAIMDVFLGAPNLLSNAGHLSAAGAAGAAGSGAAPGSGAAGAAAAAAGDARSGGSSGSGAAPAAAQL